MVAPTVQMCHCGRPLHYTSVAIQLHVQRLIDLLGENVNVEARGVTYSVPRHYIALHGIKEQELPGLGFTVVSIQRQG